MIELAWPWVLVALPLPWLAYRWAAPAVTGPAQALRLPGSDHEMPAPTSADPRSPTRLDWRAWIALFSWGLLVLAAARPQWVGEPVDVAMSGRDLMLAVDLSGSMEMEDFLLEGRQVDRLTATKAVAGQFIERRTGDRVGLILFGEQAYLQAPLTFDRNTVRTLLEESVIGLAGDKTAIGDAIGLAIKRLRDNPAEQRRLILLSDGANTAGAVDPAKAAELAAKEGVKVYTIGIGADAVEVRGLFGTRRVNPSADLDEETMTKIAEQTGGRYFRARDIKELEKIYALLDELEPVERDRTQYRPHDELFPWPLAAALLLGSGLAARRVFYE